MAIRMTGLMSGIDTEAVVGALMSAQSLKKTKITAAKTKLEWKQAKWKDMNTKLYGMYTGSVSKMRLQSSYMTKKASISDSSVASVSANVNAVNGSYTMKVNSIASTQYLTGGDITKTGISGNTSNKITSTNQKLSEINGALVGTTIKIKSGTGDGEGTDFTIAEDTTIANFTNALKSAGLNANFDTSQQRFFISSKNSGVENGFSLTTKAQSQAGGSLAMLGIGEIEASTTGVKVNGVEFLAGTEMSDADSRVPSFGGMALVTAADSKIVLNGAELTSSSSTVSVNGLSINLTSKTETDKPVTFTVSTDVDAIYNSIKKALTDYNALIKEMNEAYSADPAKDYSPLTSAQKEAMSDDEVKEWEDKIKSSLLRNDSTLDSVRSAMRGAMQSQIEYKGQKYTLANLGIMTSYDYSEGGQYHIYGDTDDSTYADQKDKLRAAIENDPEMVQTIMTGVFDNLHEAMRTKMSMTELSSAFTFYNDIGMNNELKNYKKELTDWETKLEDMESAWFKKFSAMESAMAKMQSQQSSLGSIMGN